MKQRLSYLVSICVIVVAFAGCGGGGGGTPAPPSTDFVLSGTVMVLDTSTPVSGVRVIMSNKETTTNSQGKFRLVLSGPPVLQTYVLDIAGGTPKCYIFWAKANGVAQNPTHINMPVAPKTGIDVGTIYLTSQESPPPFPPL